MHPLMKFKYVKEINGYLKMDINQLPATERFSVIQRIEELIKLLGGTSSAKKELAKAQTIKHLAGLMLEAFNEKKDIDNAFFREDLDIQVDIKLGNSEKGLLHIVERRTDDGTLSVITKEELFESISFAIVEGVATKTRAESYNLSKDGATAVIIKEEGTNAWILTGWNITKEELDKLSKSEPSKRRSILFKDLDELNELPPGERRSAHFNSAPTHVSPTTSRTNVGAEGFGDDSTDDEAINQESNVVFLQRVIQGEVEPNNSAMSRMKVIIHNPEPTDEDKNLLDKALEVWFKKLVSLIESEERN